MQWKKNFFSRLIYRSVAVSIEFDSITIVSFKKDVSGHLSVAQAVTRLVSLEDIGSEEQDEIIVSVLNELFDRLSLSRRGVYLNIPSSDSVVRFFSMPRLPRSEWGEAIPFEGQKYIPFQLGEYVSDYLILNEKDDDSDELEVLFSSIRLSVLNRYLSLFKQIGVTIVGLDSPCFSYARLLSYLDILSLHSQFCVVNVERVLAGRNKYKIVAEFMLFSNGHPRIVRSVPYVYEGEEIGESFLNEVYLTFKLFRKSLTGNVIDKVYFFSGYDLYDWDHFFSEQFGYPVEKIDMASLNLDSEVRPVALGGALVPFVQHEYVNVLKEKTPTSTSSNHFLTPVRLRLLLLGFVVFLMVLGSLYFLYSGIDSEVQLKKEKISQFMGGQFKTLQQSRSKVNAVRKDIAFLKHIRSDLWNRPSQLLLQMEPFFSDHAWIDSVVYKSSSFQKKSRVEIVGEVFTGDYVQNVLSVNDLKKNMQMTDIGKLYPFIDIHHSVQGNKQDQQEMKYLKFKLKLATYKED